MANEAIYELTQEAALNAADRFPVQQTDAATRATSATFALLGGLENNEISTNGNVTAVVGVLDVWDISGFTASDKTWTLPSSAQVGERCGFHIETGDDEFEVDIHTADDTDQINGVDGNYSTNAWSKAFITGENVIFRCVNATNPDWIVEHDGRIPCRGKIFLNAEQTGIASGSFVAVDGTLATAFDVGDLADLTNDQMVLRRAGDYFIAFAVTTTTKNVAADGFTRSQVTSGGGGISPAVFVPVVAQGAAAFFSEVPDVAAGTGITLDGFVSAWEGGGTGSWIAGANLTFVLVEERLP